MGGDHGCGVVIAGAKLALQASKKITALYLVGNQADIHAALPERGFRDHRVRVIHASEVVEMDDKPVIALRKKKDSSIARAAELVHDGEADALVSLGNTGGIFAAARLGAFPAWIAVASRPSFLGRATNLSCSTQAQTSSASRCTSRNLP